MELARPPAPGDLLISSVALSEGFFDQAVVLLLDHDEAGTLGVVINRLSDITLGDVLPQWSRLVSEPQVLYAGGPMSRNGAICLAALADSEAEPPGWRRLFHDVGLLHLDTPTEIVEGAFRDMRIYAGYAGWEPDQLAAELARGGWFLVTAEYGDIFGTDHATLWRRSLHRQGGDIAYFTTWTDEPDAN